MTERRLYRSRGDRVIWGICGGLAQYFDIDPVIIRIAFTLLIFANGVGLLAYIIMAIVIPSEGSTSRRLEDTTRENAEEIRKTAEEFGDGFRSTIKEEQSIPEDDVRLQRRRRIIVGVIIIIVGLIFLAANFNLFWWFSWNRWWPLILIVAGMVVIFGRTRRNRG